MRARYAAPVLLLAAVACGRETVVRDRAAAPGAGASPSAATGTTLDGYAPAGSCAGCHTDLARSYADVAMARSFGRPGEIQAVEEFRDARLVHGPSGFTYETRRDGGRIVQRRFETTDGGADPYEVEATFAVGSGRHARTYLHLDPTGQLFEMPVTWYTQERAWKMSPGYDRADQPDFSRPATFLCLFCHNSYPRVPAGTDTVVRPQIVPADLPSGIDCQRCHGPGERHARLAREAKAPFSEVRAAIVNPARLSRDRQMDVCMQCHLETTASGNWSALVAFGRGVFSFRPGEDLAAYRVHFDYPPGTGHDDPFEIAHQAYRLRRSACFRKSGTLTCTTCHDPHRRPADPAAYFRGKCLGCHAAAACPVAARRPDHRVAADCVSCHMPRRRTEDIVHVVMTDHEIRRMHPPESERLAPRREVTTRYTGPVVFYRPEEVPAGDARALYEGVASLLDDVDPERGLDLLRGALPRAGATGPEAAFQYGLALTARGRTAEAIMALGRAADLDPGNPRILLALGAALEAAGREDEALARYDAAVAAWPAGAAAHTNAGRLLARSGRVAEALAHFDAAAETGDPLALGNRGAVRARLGRRAEAESDLREALRIQPGLPEAALELAALLAARGEAAPAVRVLESAARRNPAHASLQTRIAWLLATSPVGSVRDGARALEHARRAVTLSGRRDARALDALAAALAESGRSAEAARVAAEAETVAGAAGQNELAAAISGRRRLYEAGARFRDGGGAPGASAGAGARGRSEQR